MKIGIDMMGGDFAPLEAIKGVKLFTESNQDVHLVLIGDRNQLIPLLDDNQIDASLYTIVDASQVIDMHEHPTKAFKEKQDSSIVKGFHLLATGKIDAFASAGNTGAMMVGSLFSIKAIEGVLRPTIGAYLPRENGKSGWLVDVGINADCKPENLLQFGILGSLFVEHVWNIEQPRVALVNIGEEEGKGNILAQAAYGLLKNSDKINFVGNIEGRDIIADKADVVVCEGFTGNVILKLLESVYDISQQRNVKDEYFDRFNFEQYGGVPVLGISKTVMIGHGISKAPAFFNMLKMAKRVNSSNLLQKIEERFKVQ
ncbi:MAG: phosphate acyltransferase PlsX [Chitinophagaceae bacterium]|nr:phosphate acyltransferase PlsX [Chitinophagaceae bacterium]